MCTECLCYLCLSIFSLRRLTALDELDCSFNELESLPAAVGKCVNLRTFAADHNFLTHLPPEVRTLTHYQYTSDLV